MGKQAAAAAGASYEIMSVFLVSGTGRYDLEEGVDSNVAISSYYP